MIIAVASGKGGTGKTTVSTNLAASLGERVRFLDCDVEEPNAHIFLQTEQTEKETVTVMVPQVDSSLCNSCGACGEICQFSAITLIGDMVMTFPQMCHSCKGCMMVCPENAVSESSRELGEIIRGNSGPVELVYGRLRIGEAMSPPLIEKVKARIDNDAINIIDAPPGTSCPVIAALRGSDYVLLVTEPTPFGLNDLVLAVEAVRTMDIPFGIIINRCDVGDDKTKKYAEEQGIPILMEIPDKREIAENYSKGIMMTDAIPEMKARFGKLSDRFGKLSDRINDRRAVPELVEGEGL
ncbi:ATP-binding protein [Desulfobacterales bacterium HSG2]|nr:ATP-binding protein [Desulfobacterales bacterium HSG2]